MPILQEAAPIISSADSAAIKAAVSDNIAVLLPVGIGIMAIMIGVSLIPRIVYKFL